jgi:tRNA (guanine37-N1)-methyltransferase|tara:strand:- start:122 stop:946 length:825 start_codon:yes stop_codon:yes gene_type:complete
MVVEGVSQMWVGIVSLFPEMFEAVSRYGITRRAVEKGLLKIATWNPREYTRDKHRTVDDKPYGGGPGMLMKVEPLKAAIEAALTEAAKIEGEGDCKVIFLSPQGRKLDQAGLADLASRQKLILVAGRYEGIDERLIDTVIDEEYSIGDYVLSGGELPAMVLIDGVTRLLPGALGDEDSAAQDSFADIANGDATTPVLLDYPQYTRPEQVEEQTVPDVLLSGNHQQIERWRRKQALGRTYDRRPDLLANVELSEADLALLSEFAAENADSNSGKN